MKSSSTVFFLHLRSLIQILFYETEVTYKIVFLSIAYNCYIEICSYRILITITISRNILFYSKTFSSGGFTIISVKYFLQFRKIFLFTDIPDTGLLCDLLWADPDKDIVGWGENDRGVSFTFGEDVVAQFLRRYVRCFDYMFI